MTGQIKTIAQITKEMKTSNDHGDVMTRDKFLKYVEEGYIIDYDGVGYFHDGQQKTDIDVFKPVSILELVKYPYVIWYNR